jgi:multisite-specific tRNA:(cytosine-C5)-methyltransferase
LLGRSDAQIGNVSVIAIGCWRGRTNISLLIPSEEANQLLDRLFAVDEDNSNDTIEKEEEERKSDKAIETIDYKQIIVEGDGLVMVKETTIHKTQLLQKEGE